MSLNLLGALCLPLSTKEAGKDKETLKFLNQAISRYQAELKKERQKVRKTKVTEK